MDSFLSSSSLLYCKSKSKHSSEVERRSVDPKVAGSIPAVYPLEYFNVMKRKLSKIQCGRMAEWLKALAC